MKTRERTKPSAEEPRWYESAARPSTPGEMTKAEPAELAPASDEEDAKRRRMRWAVVPAIVAATVAVALGNVFNSLYWASVALAFAISAQPRERVPKLLRYFSIAAVAVFLTLMVARSIIKYLW